MSPVEGDLDLDDASEVVVVVVVTVEGGDDCDGIVVAVMVRVV